MNARDVGTALCFVIALVGLQRATDCLAAGGETDATFADNGIYVYPRVPELSLISTGQVLPISQGRLLALGGIGGGPTSNYPYRSSASFALTDTGLLDLTFGDGGLLPDASQYPAQGFSTARELANGNLVLASQVLGCPSPAQCGAVDTGATYRVERHFANGTLDASYAQNGTHATPLHLGNAAILADGTVIGLGVTYPRSFIDQTLRGPYLFDALVVDAAGQSNPALAARFLTQMIRCSPTGTADLSSLAARVMPVVQWTRDDRIVFAYGPCMLKLNPDATPDSTFGSDGMSQVDNAGLQVLQVQVLDDGSVLTFSLFADASAYRVVKRLSTGSPDPAFGVGGVLARMALPFGPLSLPVQDAHGRILIAGGKVDPVTKARVSYLARFDAQMNLDTSFGANGTGLAALRNPALGWFMPTTVAVDDKDRIVLGGRVISAGGPYSSQYNEAVTRLKGDRDATSTVIEFYNASLDHYFMTWAPREISDLDTDVHRGWARTGQTFNTYTTSPAGTSSVCRFYIPPALGDSHFFGRDALECVSTGLKYPGLLLESRNFMQMYLPIAGVCPAATTQVYRVFSNRPDANHRYMTDRAVRDQMVAKGWLAEGDGRDLVVMCAPQ